MQLSIDSHSLSRVHGSPVPLSRRSNPQPPTMIGTPISKTKKTHHRECFGVHIPATIRVQSLIHKGWIDDREGWAKWYGDAMDIRLLIIEVSEKIGLIATAALVSVLVPPLRNRLLGLGQARDQWVALSFGVLLSMWGAKMGFDWLGHQLNLRSIGIMIAAILGGPRIGLIAGLIAGVHYITRVYPEAGWLGLLTSALDGVIIGWITKHKTQYFQGWRALPTVAAVQFVSLGIVAVGMQLSARATLSTAWPAILIQLLGVAVGVTLFVNVARVILGRERNAVALVEARAAADALSLHALRNRLEPHFLFNSLNALRATIRKDPEQARDMVSNLADLYRYLLHHPEDAPLSSEIEHARAYLAIEQTRLGEEKLRVETAINDDVKDLQVPALLLQPLVENAVKYGIASKQGEGLIRIAAYRHNDRLRIEVIDRAEGTATTTTKGSGMALDTLRKRLEKQYGMDASLVLQSTTEGMTAIVTVPLGKGYQNQ